MKTKIKEHLRLKYGYWVTMLLSLMIIVFFYGKALVHPSAFLFNTGGDAIKNYYTYAYYISKNNSFLEFTGLNYPFGESIFFLDSIPLLSVLLRILQFIIPISGSEAIGLLNFILIVSPAVSALFLYAVLRRIGVLQILSIIASIGLAFLAPQVHRITGHFALGFSFAIPITIYLLLRLYQSPKKSANAIFLCLYLIILFLLHAYLGMISSLLSITFLLLSFIAIIKKTNFIIAVNRLVVSSIIPSVVFFILVWISDNHSTRTTNPYGLFQYVSDYTSVFFPNNLFGIFNIGIENMERWEGWAYTGMITNVFLVPAFFYLLFLFIKNKGKNQTTPLLMMSFSGGLALLFSMAIPFIWGFEWIPDSIPLIKKFRSLGRFAWLFYYTSGILSVWFISQLSSMSKFTRVLVLIPLLTLAEAFPVHKFYSRKISENSNAFDLEKLTRAQINLIGKCDSSEYQAIIPLPFFHFGSENFTVFAEGEIRNLSLLTSFHSGIPLFACPLTHTSICESKQIIQLLSPPYYEKIMNPLLLKNKDILLLVSDTNLLNSNEKLLVQRSDFLYSNSLGSLYSISKVDLFRVTDLGLSKRFLPSVNKAIAINTYYSLNKDRFLYFDNFDSLKTDTSYMGSGAYYAPVKRFNRVASFNPGTFQTNKRYMASYWSYNNGVNCGQDIMNALFIEAENDAWMYYQPPKHSMVINGDWTLNELEFEIKDSTAMVNFFEYYDSKGDIKRTIIDNFLIREKNDTIIGLFRDIKSNKRFLSVNNHFIRADGNK